MADIKMTPTPHSSNVESLGHDPATNTLAVKFKSGSVYHYEGVDESKHAALAASPSIGRHLREMIIGNHKATRQT